MTNDIAADTPPASRAAQSPKDHPAALVFDLHSALERVQGDRELLEELGSLFSEECVKNVDEIRAAMGAGDVRVVERLAHTIKGAAANLGANALSAVALELELYAHAGTLADAGPFVEKIQAEITRLLPELDALCHKAIP